MRHILAALATSGWASFCGFAAADQHKLQVMPVLADVSAQSPVPLASHRAVYELTLWKAMGTKSPTSVKGRIAFDFTGTPCDGYVQNFHQMTELQPAEGPTRISDMHSATFEDGDGKNFDFKMQTSVDASIDEEVDGKARRASNGPLLVDLAKPKKSRLDFSGDVVFPTDHLKRVLEAARQGKHILQEKVYDGSETGDKIYETTAIIGAPTEEPAAEKAVQIPQLQNMRRWPVSIGYFDAGKKDDAPNYTLAFDLYDNGISRALRLDYGDFVLAGEISSLELLPQAKCTK
jgi:hypothetical protein